MSLAAVVLAAGAGRRFAGGVHKLRVQIDGVAMVRRSVDNAVESGIGPVLVVTGAEPLSDLMPPSVSELHAQDWSAGRSHSLATAIRALESSGVDALVVGLADMPGVPAEAWRSVAASDSPIAIATYDGRRRPPVRLARDIWAELDTTGDVGASALMRRRPGLVVEVPVPGNGDDVDTVADLGGR